MLNIAVIFGGVSCEHDISIITGIQVINNLDKYNVIPIYITKDGRWLYSDNYRTIESVVNEKGVECTLSNFSGELLVKGVLGRFKKLLHIDGVFVALHGLNGEDGSICALCNLSNILCFNSQILPSALSLDKIAMKNYLFGLKVSNLIKYISVNKSESISDVITKINKKKLVYPLIVKPSNLGSSIGIQIVKSEDELEEKLNIAYMFDNNLLIEEKLDEIKEYNIAIFKGKDEYVLSDIEEPIGSDEILSYSDKYLNGEKSSGIEGLTRVFPAKIDENLKLEIQGTALKIYKLLNLSGVVRFDFIYQSDTDLLYLNELNTTPGSYANYLFQDISFPNMLDRIIKNAYFEKEQDKDKIKYFESSVLSDVNLSIKK